MPEEDRGENKVVLFYASKGLFKHNVSNTFCLGLQLLNFFFGCDNVFFLQLVWATTRFLGCGVSFCEKSAGVPHPWVRGGTEVVCDYAPG